MSRKLLIIAVFAVAVLWVITDLVVPRHSDLRKFDAKEVARLETDMWRAYYDRHQVGLYFELGELLRTQYGFPWLCSQIAAYDAAKAAFVFKRGSGRTEYEQALPNLNSFYAAIRRNSNIAFDVSEAAHLELEWWIVHRERSRYGKAALAKALADLQAALYREAPERFTEHAAARAEAMIIRDDRAAQGGVTEQDWARIHELLDQSWSSLHRAVNQGL